MRIQSFAAVLLLFAAVVLGSFATAADSPLRRYTDASGKFEVQASFVEFKGGKVVLKRENGKLIRLAMRSLSKADQQFVRDEISKRNLAASTAASKAVQGAGAGKAKAGGWNQWRGPNRDGVSQESGLLDRWDTAPPLVWRTKGFGGGYSSVSISGGMIYTMGRVDGKVHLIAANLSDGEIRWKTPVSEGDSPNCTPTVDGDRVYGVSHNGVLACVDASNGKEIWRVSYPREFGGRMMSGWGYSESPLVDGDSLICTPGAQNAMLASLDKTTGNVRWKSSMPGEVGRAGRDGAAYSSVVVSRAAGVKQYVQLVGRGVVSVDAKTGQMLWGYNRIANGTANVPTPIVKGNYVFCSSGYGDGGSALLEISKAGNRLNAREVYYQPANRLQNHHGGMILLGDHVYMGEGHNKGFPVCFNLTTGRPAWGPGRGPGSGSAAIVYADGHVYFRYENGVMALIEATPEEFRLKGTFKIASSNGRSWPHPVIFDGKLFLRDQHELLCYDIKKK